MCGDLFVPSGNEADVALTQSVQERDNGVSAKTENYFDSEPLQVLDQQVRSDSCSRSRAAFPNRDNRIRQHATSTWFDRTQSGLPRDTTRLHTRPARG